ncbi:hypothetical protein OH77DRAFT_1431658 [Trametes cingulata]|nr:hypothetical protein OH77DRAFT_1431658 [Trametes cingulata]
MAAGRYMPFTSREHRLFVPLPSLPPRRRSHSCAPFASCILMSVFDKYKIPRSQVDLEAIAQQMFLYLRVHAEDTQFLSYDPTRRDQIIAELYAHPDCKPSCWPQDIVGANLPLEKYDEYLAHANDAIAQLTPPKSLEDRVVRSHIAIAATMVFSQYKVRYALQDHHDLFLRVGKRWSDLMDEWMKTEFLRMFPDRAAKVSQNRQASTPSTRHALPSPPTSSHSGKPKALAADEIKEYLQNPHTVLGKRFLCTPPPGGDDDYKGMWQVESYSARMRDGHVDQEFQVLVEAFEGASVPMGRDEVEFLLKHSVVVG